MKLARLQFPRKNPPRRRAGFTMVEIAICLAVIVFALVAVIGVLPLGMNVQKDNREETIIGQDAVYFMDAIRNGNQGLDDLTNYLIRLTNYVYRFDVNSNFIGPLTIYGYTTTNAAKSVGGGSYTSYQMPLTNGASIVGVLSTPEYEPVYQLNSTIPDGFLSNFVVADFRALSGPVVDKFPQSDTHVLNLAFAYRLTPEIAPVSFLEKTSVLALTMQTNLHDVRLNFRWPVLPFTIGNNRQTYRTQLAASQTAVTNERSLYFFDPNNIVFVPPR